MLGSGARGRKALTECAGCRGRPNRVRVGKREYLAGGLAFKIDGEVLRQLWCGKSVKEIAHSLMLSDSMIKGRMKTLLYKFRAMNRT